MQCCFIQLYNRILYNRCISLTIANARFGSQYTEYTATETALDVVQWDNLVDKKNAEARLWRQNRNMMYLHVKSSCMLNKQLHSQQEIYKKVCLLNVIATCPCTIDLNIMDTTYTYEVKWIHYEINS